MTDEGRDRVMASTDRANYIGAMVFARQPADRTRPQTPKPVTRDWLMRAAVHYLERYASSAENLRRVLARKAERRARGGPDADVPLDERVDAAPLIEETLARLVELKMVDDSAFAKGRLATLRRRGASIRGVASKLAQKGVARETIEAVAAADEIGDEDAARVFARRRRLGPHRSRDREVRRDRDIAAMMRAGFSFTIAREAIDGEAVDTAPTESDR